MNHHFHLFLSDFDFKQSAVPGKSVCSIDADDELGALALAGHANWHQHVSGDHYDDLMIWCDMR